MPVSASAARAVRCDESISGGLASPRATLPPGVCLILLYSLFRTNASVCVRSWVVRVCCVLLLPPITHHTEHKPLLCISHQDTFVDPKVLLACAIPQKYQICCCGAAVLLCAIQNFRLLLLMLRVELDSFTPPFRACRSFCSAGLKGWCVVWNGSFFVRIARSARKLGAELGQNLACKGERTSEEDVRESSKSRVQVGHSSGRLPVGTPGTENTRRET